MHAQIRLNIATEVVHVAQQHADQSSVNPARGLTEIIKKTYMTSPFYIYRNWLIRHFFSKASIIILLLLFDSDAAASKLVYVYENDTEVCSFSFDDNVKVILKTDCLYVELTDKQVQIPLSNHVSFKIEEPRLSLARTRAYSLDTSIHPHFKIEGNLVILQGLPSKSSVKFYSLTGILLGSSLTNEDGSLFYDLGSLRNMVVLVETAICNFKISLRDEH